MNRKAVTIIRKLLQFATSGTAPEHKLARERAHELMEKHGIEVADTRDHRELIPGVAGVYWRQVLLTAIAKVYRCRVLRSTAGKAPQAVLAGLPGDVNAARGMYQRACLELLVLGWRSCGLERPEGLNRQVMGDDGWPDDGDDEFDIVRGRSFLGDILGAGRYDVPFYGVGGRIKSSTEKITLPELDEARAIWFRLYLNSAAETTSQRLQKAVPPKPAGPPMPKFPGKTEEEKDNEREKEVITEEMRRLSEIFTKNRARELVNEAAYLGKGAFDSVDWKWRQKIYVKKLAAASEAFPPPPPPPPPGRFTFLDADD